MFLSALSYEVDWERFCSEVGFTRKAALEVRDAVERAGSAGFLKPIKEQAPEHITYREIKWYLIQEERGFPLPKDSISEDCTIVEDVDRDESSLDLKMLILGK